MKKMSKNRFLKLLPKSGWKLDKEDGEIRRTIKNKSGVSLFCPITAVAHRLTGDFYHTADFDLAAEQMGLDLTFASHVASAADGDLDDDAEKKLRQKLVAACGIKKDHYAIKMAKEEAAYKEGR